MTSESRRNTSVVVFENENDLVKDDVDDEQDLLVESVGIPEDDDDLNDFMMLKEKTE